MEFFLNFWLNQFQNCPIQIKKMKDVMFSFQLKKNYFYRTLTNDARHKNLPPLLGLTRILKSYHKRNDRSHTMKGMTEENSRKNWSDQYHVREIARLDWSKTAKYFSVNSHGKFLSWREASRQAGKQASGFLSSDRYFSFFWVVISTIYVVLFILGKCFLDSYQLFLIFTEVWLYNSRVSR